MSGDMAFTGKLGPQGDTYTPAADPSAECWVANNGGLHVVSLTMETPWNTPSSTQDGYQKEGEQLGRTIGRYLRGPV
jgi:hypothetical protein